MRLFHGTSNGDIQRFVFGCKGFGEQENPVNCLWTATTFAAARTHAITVVGPKRKTNPNFVYELDFPCDAVRVNITRPELVDKRLEDAILKKIFWRPLCWLPKEISWLDGLAKVGSSENDDSASKNKMFRVLRAVGVEAVENPNFNWVKRGSLSFDIHTFNPVAGAAAVAIINLRRLKIISCTSVV
jgi:hypothetical protein